MCDTFCIEIWREKKHHTDDIRKNMMGQFIVGKEYYPYQREYGAMKVIRRTEKTIWCEKNMVRWSMRIKLDPDGNEYAVDTCVPQRDRDAFTYMTDEEV